MDVGNCQTGNQRIRENARILADWIDREEKEG